MSAMDATAAPRPAVVEPPLTDPRDLRRADLRRLVVRTFRAFNEDNIAALASGLAFNLFLSLFPSTVAAIAIYGLVRDPVEVARQIEGLQRQFPVLPPDAVETVERVVLSIPENRLNGAVAVFGVLGGLFSATGAAAALINGLNRAHGIRESRNFVVLRLNGLAIALALVLALAARVLTVVLGPQVRNWLVPDPLRGTAINVAFAVGQIVVALVVVLLLFVFVYWIGPDRPRPPWQWLSPGAVLGVLGWLVVSGGFALYTSTFGNYSGASSIYAGFGGIIVLLLWLQLSMLVVLVGAEVNAELEAIRAERAQHRAAALGDDAAEAPAGPCTRPADEGEQVTSIRPAAVAAALGPAIAVPGAAAEPLPSRRWGWLAWALPVVAAAGVAAAVARGVSSMARRHRPRRRR